MGWVIGGPKIDIAAKEEIRRQSTLNEYFWKRQLGLQLQRFKDSSTQLLKYRETGRQGNQRARRSGQLSGGGYRSDCQKAIEAALDKRQDKLVLAGGVAVIQAAL